MSLGSEVAEGIRVEGKDTFWDARHTLVRS